MKISFGGGDGIQQDYLIQTSFLPLNGIVSKLTHDHTVPCCGRRCLS